MLEGVRVVELASYIAAPAAGCMLADWGAEVIKVEPPGGDPIRKFMDNVGASGIAENPVFELDNRGKRSIAIDIRSEGGAEVMRRLVAQADVFLTNVRPAALARAGLDWAQVSARHPRLIYASVTGYGLDGPEKDRPGFDLAAFWSRAGHGRLTTPKGQEPIPMRTAVGDHTTGIAMASGIAAALYAREKTGKGRLVETSLLRTGIYCLGSDLSLQLRFGRVASTRTRDQAPSPLNSFYRTQDGNWLVMLTRHAQDDWQRIANAVGMPELTGDPRFRTPRDRKVNAAELIALLDSLFDERPLEEWARRLDEQDLVWAPVQSPEQVANDPQANAAGAFVEIPGAGGAASFRSIATPVKFHGVDTGPQGPSPTAGEHTDSVLGRLGYTAEEVAALRSTRSVA
ncbi:CaiB/BaiF CoA transferase family protein [Zavarzinia sp. CC-PAN008]|uniref:CaiB/BaiF CoA transferase family protein n=1 Tax=Zavarzinia sp. CC-PAN008 TaxID=3243332 RepID=UPI003F7422A5